MSWFSRARSAQNETLHHDRIDANVQTVGEQHGTFEETLP